jgi:hypothetical protein
VLAGCEQLVAFDEPLGIDRLRVHDRLRVQPPRGSLVFWVGKVEQFPRGLKPGRGRARPASRKANRRLICSAKTLACLRCWARVAAARGALAG